MNSKAQKGTYKTVSGIEIKPVYGEEKPGEYPFTRGVYTSMYRGKLWTMRQYAGFGTAKEANERFKYLLSQGTTGLSVAFDLPTQMGRDSDHTLAKGEVGRVGVAISTLQDMEDLFSGIPLKEVSVSMTINATAPILLALLLLVAEKQGVPWNVVRGTIQNDILKEYMARGTYIYPPTHALRLVTDIFEFCSNTTPQFYPISISGYHIREAGSTAIEEVAFTLADGICYVEAALARGLKIDEFAPRLAFFFNCHNEFLEEIAKFRAARKLWAEIMHKRFNAKKPESMMLRFHTQTAGSSLTAQQPHNNVVRTTIQALAAVLGGTQSLHLNGFDEALSLPTEESATLALRSQQIIAYESGVAASADPLGGSHLIEEWTNQIVSGALERIQKIDQMGGMLKAIEAGFPQNEIDNSAYRYQKEIESKDRIIVGVNQFEQDNSQTSIPLLKINPIFEEQQVKRISSFKKLRNTDLANKAVLELKENAKSTTNLMPKIVTALKAGATLGEVSDALRAVFGEYRAVR